ncbi:Bifunctional purine biosynthetic protein ade1 [Friedmanniomyces endolithicus]|nr:Bifunctional purine biosynthetic protein ade1 [Friedmanniomyces endolithicus]
MPSDVVVEINAKDVGLEKIASGKVREIFKVDDETLLFVATDRISAYDVVLENARDYAEKRGILIADTKFEFGLDAQTNELVLVDEVLTPDSSRFWSAESYVVGRSQQSYDKQYLRDWLTSTGNRGKEGVTLPEDVARRTAEKYTEAYERLTGKAWP